MVLIMPQVSDFLNGMNDTLMRTSGFSLNRERLMASLSQYSAWENVLQEEIQARADCIHGIFKNVASFCVEIYGDSRMLVSAISSLPHFNASDVERRINEITHVRTTLTTFGNHQCELENAFRHVISSEVRNLFFYVDVNYLQQFHMESDPVCIEKMKATIVHECERAISYQKMLIVANTFFHECAENMWNHLPIQPVHFQSENTVINTRNYSIPGAIANSMASLPQRLKAYYEREYRARIFDSTLPPNPALLEIQQFYRDQLPQEIQDRAAEIHRLKASYVSDPRYSDEVFLDGIWREIMEIPVFDASHPQLVTAMQNARNGGSVGVLNDRSMRHSTDMDTLVEYLLIQRESGNRALCAICRHPEPEGRGMNPSQLMIDVDLQIQTLDFLRARVVSI